MASADTMLFAFGDDVNTGSVSALVNVLAAIGVVYVMQIKTGDAGLRCRRSLITLVHRASLATLAIALVINAGVTVTAPEMPRLIDVVVQMTVLLVVVFSAWQHSPPDHPS